MSMVDDELSPRPVVHTAEEATALRKESEAVLGTNLLVSNYERGLYAAEGKAPPLD